jgi:uncharacterized protein YecE (DUF72 family)
VLRVGVAGWDYRDWWGLVYPLPRPRAFDPLSYLARYFDTIEINSTFYRPPAAKVAAGWAARVAANPRFEFTAKLWQRFTHERDTPWTKADVEQVTEGLVPLHDAGRLGCVLLQFPWSFKRTAANEEWLGDLLTAFARFPLGVEVRHGSWNDPAFYAALTDRNAAVVNIDQPVFHHSIRPGAKATAQVGYVRLHGRNYENWFRDGAATHERYDYLYSVEELEGWLDRIHEVARHTRDTYVITNNHYRGQAAVNAAMLRKLDGADVVLVPPELLHAYTQVLGPLGVTASS